MTICFFCKSTVLQQPTPTPCGCASFHDDCFREHLILAEDIEMKSTCPCCNRIYPLTSDEKENVRQWSMVSRRSDLGLCKWRKTDDIEFLLDIAQRKPYIAHMLSTAEAARDTELATVFCRKLRKIIPKVYLPPLPVAISTGIMSRSMARKYVKDSPQNFFLLPKRWRTAEAAIQALRAGFNLYKDLPLELQRTPKVLTRAVSQYPQNIGIVPEERRTMSLCMMAVKKDGRAYAELPENFKKNRLLQATACSTYPKAIDFICDPDDRKELVEVVLSLDGEYVDRFENLTTEEENLAISTSPTCVLKLNRGWTIAIQMTPVDIVHLAREKSKRIPPAHLAYAIARHPNTLWDASMTRRMKALAIIAGSRPENAISAGMVPFFVCHGKVNSRSYNFNFNFPSRDLARMAVERFGPINMIGNESHFDLEDVRMAIDTAVSLPVIAHAEGVTSDHTIFSDSLLRLQFFGAGAVDKSRHLVDFLVSAKYCKFHRCVLTQWFPDLTLTEKMQAVHRYPHLLVLAQPTERRKLVVPALTSCKPCRGLVFAKDVISTVLTSLPEKQRLNILRQHPQYAMFCIKTTPSSRPRPPRPPPPPPSPEQSNSHLLRSLRKDLLSTLEKTKPFPKEMKDHAYALVDASTPRRALDLIAFRFGPATEKETRFLLRRGRMPSSNACASLFHFSLREMNSLVDSDLRLAAESCSLSPPEIKFFLKKKQYHILRRMKPSTFDLVLRYVDALPT